MPGTYAEYFIWINLVNPYKGPMRKILLFFDEESEVQDHTASQR